MPEPAELARQLAKANELLDARARALDLAERRLADARSDARTLAQTNERLNSTLTTAREALESMRTELDALATPPNSFGLVVGIGADTVDVSTGGRWLRCSLSPDVGPDSLFVGARVLLNEALLVIGVAEDPGTGETARLVEVLPSPEPTTTSPEPTTTFPESTTTFPQPTATFPELVEGPPPTPTFPESTTTFPQPTTTFPESTTTFPEPVEGPPPTPTVPEELSEERGKRHEGQPPRLMEHSTSASSLEGDQAATVRLLVTGASGDDLVVAAAASLPVANLRPGSTLLVDRRALVALAVVPRSEVADLTLEEVPDVSYADIGGLGAQIEQIRDAVELPFRHRELFAEFGLRPPKGVLLYGPPGCGKTMIAKAVANSAGSHFLNIKGPELLDKYVGETERQIRAIFIRAKEHATSGRPVIVFFDEMDALFRTRGSGVSSDVEATIVPQLLAEIDGVEGLANVIVIGATNREDLIDPAILRPGRLDVKIKLDRPDRAGAAEILARYLTSATPLNTGGLDPDAFRSSLIDTIVERLYARTEANRFIEVTYASGDKETLYVGDFVSGAMLAGVVDRAKKAAIKELISGGERGLRHAHVDAACAAEIGENEELPNTTNPDDWARVSGRKGERIVFLRTLVGARALNP